MSEDYTHQINKAIDYIIDNLDAELKVEDIAKHCHFSKYYFNRLFKSMVGESIYAFIKRLRLERSAFLLRATPESTITDISSKFGYSSSNYCSAFKKEYKISPFEYRKSKREQKIIEVEKYQAIDLSEHDFDYYDQKTEIITLEPFMMIYERYIGNYREVSQNWLSFLEKTKSYIKPDTLIVDISYDDPTITDTDRCIYDIGMSTDQEIKGFQHLSISGGKYAAFAYTGPTEGIYSAYQGIMKVWLPEADIILDDRKMLSLYECVNEDNTEVTMKICIPVK